MRWVTNKGFQLGHSCLQAVDFLQRHRVARCKASESLCSLSLSTWLHTKYLQFQLSLYSELLDLTLSLILAVWSVFWLTVGIRKKSMAKPNIRTRACSWFTNESQPWISNYSLNNKIKKKSNIISRHKELIHHAQKDEVLMRGAHVTAEEVSFFRHAHWSKTLGCIQKTFSGLIYWNRS